MLDIIGILIFLSGILITGAATVAIIVLAFRHSANWGIATLCIPLALFFFVAMNWRLTAQTFLLWNIGLIILICGMLMCSQMGS